MMDQATTNLLFSVLGSVATAVGAGIAWHFSRRNSLQALEQMSRDNAAFAMELMRDIRSWASEVIDTLSQAAYQSTELKLASSNLDILDCPAEPPFVSKLSSLVERGRFFFPNSHKESIGTHKLPAYRGTRHAALDPVVAAIRVLEGTLGKYPSKYRALIEMRKTFVSAIQPILGPDHNNRVILGMLKRYDDFGNPDKTMGGLMPENNDIAQGVNSLLNS
jgi:hypothetical protein